MDIYCTVYCSAPTGAPQDFFIGVASPTTLQLEWRQPRYEDTNGLIRSYIINITELETGASWQQRVEDDTDALIDSLHPFYSYSLSIATETVAIGPFTPPITVEMPEDGRDTLTNIM